MNNPRFRLFIGSRKVGDYRAAKGKLTVGRSATATVTIDDPMLDDIHAEIVGDENRGFRLRALGVNPLRVNGQRIRESRTLASGDKIELGTATLELVADQTNTTNGASQSTSSTLVRLLISPIGAGVAISWLLAALAMVASGAPRLEHYNADGTDFNKFVVDKLDSSECSIAWASQPTAKKRFLELIRNAVRAEQRGATPIAFTYYSEALSIAGDIRCVPVRYARMRRDATKAALPKQPQRT